MSKSSTPDTTDKARPEGILVAFPDVPEVMVLRVEVEHLKRENFKLLLCIAGLEERTMHVQGLEAQNRMLMQLSEALGDFNRYHASHHLGYPASDNEAFDHYVLNGGKAHFDHTHPPRG
jgi:hypothetical protein